jgi:hypothetical protein
MPTAPFDYYLCCFFHPLNGCSWCSCLACLMPSLVLLKVISAVLTWRFGHFVSRVSTRSITAPFISECRGFYSKTSGDVILAVLTINYLAVNNLTALHFYAPEHSYRSYLLSRPSLCSGQRFRGDVAYTHPRRFAGPPLFSFVVFSDAKDLLPSEAAWPTSLVKARCLSPC